VRRQIGPYVRDMDDAGAELRLRGEEFPTHLGSGLIDYSQKMTTAAMHMADMNV
jgi:hypothetical protein